jgi:uncharacterized protein
MVIFDAIQSGDAGRVRDLLRADPSLGAARDATGVSAVMHAQYHRRPDLVAAVLDTGPELDVFDAAALGRVDQLRELLDEEPERARWWSGDGFSPLHLAAFFGHSDAVALLIERGADVVAVARNAMRVQPLHSATAGHDVATVRLLLAAGADPDARQHGGWTPLMAARQHGDAEIERVLLDYGAGDGGSQSPPASGKPATS